jgi:hypothetical protein
MYIYIRSNAVHYAVHHVFKHMLLLLQEKAIDALQSTMTKEL